MMIEAIPSRPSDSPGPAKTGRASYYASNDTKAGMVLVVPAYDDATKINPLGGSIVITLAMVHDKVIKFDLWNTSVGASVETFDMAGEVLDTHIIPFKSNHSDTVTEVMIDVSGVQTIIVSFVGTSGVSAIMTCRHPLKTKSPSGWTTPEPTNEPTPGPTAEPTVEPTAEPTAGPTTTEDKSICPEDIQLLHVSPEVLSGPKLPPLSIKSRDLSSVVLSLSKQIPTAVSSVFVEFRNEHYQQCLGFDSLEWRSTIDSDFTAQCMKSVPLSIVTVYMVDETVGNSDVEIPKCCHAYPRDSNVVKYTFQIYCVSQCPEEEE